MKYFLDTNICIYTLKGMYKQIENKIKNLTPDTIKIPSIVKAELLLGGEKSKYPQKTLSIIQKFLFPFEIVAFCDQSAVCYSKIRKDLELKGKIIGPNDLIIASTVLANEGILVTHNINEFKRVKDLQIQDWTNIK